MKKLNNRTPVVFYCGLLLLCLALISSYMTSDLYASYATSATGGDSARVAKFKVAYSANVNGEPVVYSEYVDLGEIVPGGESRNITVIVENESEVAVQVKVYVYNVTGNLPLDAPRSGTANAEPIGTSSALAPGDTDNYSFNLKWDEEKTDPSYAGKTDILQIKIVVEQVD